ncbi:MAG: SoxR reducing system RseC family protein [bacterium]|nr:SoxR reducing system RseC family protein [bacterium]
MLSEPETSGRVIRIEGDFVEIAIPRSERCKSCGICPFGKDDTVLLRIQMSTPVKIGDRVKIRTEDKYIILSAFILYIVPVIALLMGYILGGTFFSLEIFKIISGFLFMGISFWVNRIIDKKLRFPQIVEPIE